MRPLQAWGSFPEMLVSETDRLAMLFDAHGRVINPNRPIVP